MNRINRVILVFLSMVLAALPVWLHVTFGASVSFDKVFFHILVGPDALIGTDTQIIQSFVGIVVLIPIIIAGLFELILLLAKQRNNVVFWRYIHVLERQSVLVLIFPLSILYAGFSLGAVRYFYQQAMGKDYFATVYVKPEVKLSSNVHHKNLIVLYVESLEQGLVNEKIFGANLIAPIDELSGVTVKKFVEAPGTGWTIAGMVASQCAIPLEPRFGSTLNRTSCFLPKVVCISDVLASLGYEQYFFVGHDLKFNGMLKFYKSHGYQNLYGVAEFARSGMNHKLFTGWGPGLHDDTLLDVAFRHIVSASRSTKPFSVVVMTADSHAPYGKFSPQCYQAEKDRGFMGAYQCTSRFVAEFVQKLQGVGVLNNTTLIIMGDHLFMEQSEQTKYFPKPRYVYFKIIDRDIKIKPTRNLMTHFDVAPTILELLNIQLNTKQRFGLGVSIFANKKFVDYQKIFRLVTNQVILNPSKTYNEFWF